MEALPSPLSLWLLMHFLLANTDDITRLLVEGKY